MEEDKYQSNQRINSAVLIDLKAELFKKREILKQEKLQREATELLKVPKKRKSLKLFNQCKESQKRTEQVSKSSFEDEDALQKSKNILLQKTTLYEKLNSSNTIPEDEDNEKYLVNFQKKIVDKIIKEKYEKEEKDSDENIEYKDIPSVGPDEEWVDYTDYLGRSRRCMRKDLIHLMKIDKEFSGNISKGSKSLENSSQKEMLRLQVPIQEECQELKTKHCEVEEKESVNDSPGPIHYQNVLHKEIRNHGIGYYGFSTEENERAQQMKTLSDLREQTVQQREMSQRLKQKRKALLDARLEKVRLRKQLKPQKADKSETDMLSDEDDEDQIEQQKVPSDVNEKEKISEESKSSKPFKIRPWDIGKDMAHAVNIDRTTKYTQDSWIQEKREERNSEFAPPTFY